MLNPVWLKSLVAIVQTGSFQSAARALGLAQPTVSQHLQKLEEQVGVTLVQRSRSGCQPTTRALAFMPHATALLDMHARQTTELLAALTRQAENPALYGASGQTMPTSGSRDTRLDDLDKLAGGFDRFLLAAAHDLARDLRGKLLFAVDA